ncbi:MAG: radical SAM protein, partial [Alphaproteobacteria bacterium]|nr:radical SAM protein [Alphaproteobacteria bacterium]
LDRLIYLREEEGLRFKFIMQIDTMAHRTPRFIEKSARAGCNRVYIGLENLNPDNLLEVKKRQNKIWEYRKMLQLWKEHGIIIYVGYILGFPSDTPESIRRDIELLKRELPVDLVEFLILTPLPGSADHQRMHAAGTWMDPDMNKYDLEHVTARHPTMSAEELEAVYREAWDQYYTPEHVETVLKRGAVHGVPLKKLMYGLGGFYASLAIEGVHPMQAGGWRRKVRTQRRSGMPIESPLIFYPRRLWEIFDSYVIRLLRLYVTYDRIRKRIEADPNAGQYMDASIAPVTEEEAEEDDLIKTFEDVLPETHDASRPTAA